MTNKNERIIKVGEGEYRRLRRREQQLLMAINHIRIAWQALSRLGKESGRKK